jgi:hypothetical protein
MSDIVGTTTNKSGLIGPMAADGATAADGSDGDDTVDVSDTTGALDIALNQGGCRKTLDPAPGAGMRRFWPHRSGYLANQA